MILKYMIVNLITGASFPSTEEVVDCHQSDCGCVSPYGHGKLLGKALLSPAANTQAGIQQ